MLSLHRPAGLSSPIIPYILPSSAPSCPSLLFPSAINPAGHPCLQTVIRQGPDMPATHLEFPLPRCVYIMHSAFPFFWTTESVKKKCCLLKGALFFYHQQRETWCIGCLSVTIIATSEKMHTQSHNIPTHVSTQTDSHSFASRKYSTFRVFDWRAERVERFLKLSPSASHRCDGGLRTPLSMSPSHDYTP